METETPAADATSRSERSAAILIDRAAPDSAKLRARVSLLRSFTVFMGPSSHVGTFSQRVPYSVFGSPFGNDGYALTRRSRLSTVTTIDTLIQSIRGWPHPATGPYRIEIHLADIQGRIECVGLLIGHLADWPPDKVPYNLLEYTPQPIPASLLRQIPLLDLIEESIEIQEGKFAHWAATDPAEWLKGHQDTPEWAAEAIASINARGDRRGRKGHPPQHFVEVAAVYRSAYRLREAPTQAVANHWSVSKSTAAKWVAKARDRGLLPETSRGKPSA